MTRKDSTDPNNDINGNEHPLKNQLVIKLEAFQRQQAKLGTNGNE